MVRVPLPQRPLNAAIDRAVRVHQPVVASYVGALRRRSPDADPQDIVDQLTTQYLAAVTGTGAAVGGAAAAPAVGTLAAIGLSAGEVVAFLEATTLYALAVAEVHGLHIEDVERRRTLLLAVLAGESGAALMEKATGRGEAAWGRFLPDKVPRPVVEQVNRQLTKWALRRFGTRQGMAAFGRLVPFGVGAAIGGSANLAIGRGIVGGVRRAFGPAPATFAEPAPVRGRTVRGELLADPE